MAPGAPEWAEVRAFLKADEWRELASKERGGKRSGHIFYEKVLDDGRVLQTHVPHSKSASLSPGRLASILRYQLEVSADEFWDCIQNDEPVDRPSQVEDEPVAFNHEAWVVAVLKGKLHMSDDDINALNVDEAETLVYEFWSQRST